MTSGGLATAVALAGGIGEIAADAAEQQTLFEADAPLPVPPVARGLSGPKGGRPKGARNRSTEEWRAYLLSRYRSPLVVLMELYSRTPEELAREMQLYKYHDGHIVMGPDGAPALATGEAAGMIVQAAIAALPYLHQKQPLAVETNGKLAGLIVIGDLAGVADAGDGLLTLDVTPAAVSATREQYQQLSEEAGVRPEDARSDDDAKILDNQGEPYP